MESTIANPSNYSELVLYSQPMSNTAGVVTLIIMTIGVMGNLLTIVALLRNSKIRTVAAVFITSLCISDLMFCFVVLPFAAIQFFSGEWDHGSILCTIIPLLRYGCVGISLMSIATISINRYILIAWPHLYPRIYTQIKVAIYIAFIWMFSYGVLVPTIFGVWGEFGFDDKLGTCSIKRDMYGRSSKTVLFVVGFALPCIVIVVCYANIFWVVHQSHVRLRQHNNTANYKRSEMKITKMVLVIFVCFVACYLPITIVKIFDEHVTQPPLHVIGYMLLYMSACVNPLVYVTMNRQYRHAYLDTLKCRYSNILDSQQTQTPQKPSQHHNSHLSVAYLKTFVNNGMPKE